MQKLSVMQEMVYQLGRSGTSVLRWALAGLILALAHSATAQRTGTYSGDGNDDRAITGLGFQPAVVIIKGDGGGEAFIRTSTMTGDVSASLGSGSTLQSNHIQSLDADGFTLGDDNNVNEDGSDFYWAAFAASPGAQTGTGTYTGNGSSQSITGTVFSPEYVIVISSGGHEPVHRSASMSTTFQFKGDSGSSGRITSLDATGFSVGSNAEVNEGGTTYHYVAWNKILGVMNEGSYSGNEIDDQNIAGVGFQPKYLILKDSAGERGVHRTESLSGDSTLEFEGNVNVGNAIQALQADGFQVGSDVTVNKDTSTIYWIAFASATTEVTLASFEATGHDGEVLLEWETASELDNLGFQVYRSENEDGPYERITASAIPGLGSSVVGANYSCRDTNVSNGSTYYYRLEDIETTGQTEMHGPVSATPEVDASTDDGEDDSGAPSEESLITYGEPASSSWRVLRRGRHQVVVELRTEGFYASPQEDGTVRITIPDFAELTEAGAPSVPVKRMWVEAIAGRKVELVSVKAHDVEAFTSLRPSEAAIPELVASRDGTVRASRRRARKAFRGEGLSPSSAARVVEVGFQGEVKKALVELAPVRWDASGGQLLLARRLVVRLSFQKREPWETTTQGGRGRRYRKRGSHDERSVVARLATTERGLYAVRYEDVFHRRRGVRASKLRLSRQGESVAYHLEPNPKRFKPGSTLYFMSEGASVNPYGNGAIYELEVGQEGAMMLDSSEAPSGEATTFYMKRVEQEQNRYYQAALVEAPDRWLWDLLFAPVTKSYPFEVSALASTTQASSLSVWLQGVSDFEANPDHHVRVYVNGSLLGELSWDGKESRRIDVELLPGVLTEGENILELENVGDTGATYSMVMLDRFALHYPRVAVAEGGTLEGSWTESGVAEVSGLSAQAHVLELSGDQPRWLSGAQVSESGSVRFRAEAGGSYYAVNADAVRRPEVRQVSASNRLKSRRNRAEYLVIGPRGFLAAAGPLLEHRQREGLKVKSVAIEDVYSEFGYGETTPEALREFLRYAYHNWREPSLRYVVLLGDASFDFKDYMETGVANHVPPLIVKTTYLWTASDPGYAAVNGEDLLPDLALGRLPASSVDEVSTMVQKILAYESGGGSLTGDEVVLVTDDADEAGNFDADALELSSGVLAKRQPRRISLNALGAAATTEAIVEAFDGGASLMSYMGHGGIHLWASENVFNIFEVPSLQPQAQQPLLLTMNCLNGYFHFPFFDSMAEKLVKAEGKGAIAAFSPSGLSLNTPAHRYHEALLEELVSGRHERFGDAVLAAQAAYADTGAFPELLSIYHLFGDPALTLR